MSRRSLLFAVTFIFPATVLLAQTIFTKLPAELQMFPRQADGFGRFTLSGITTNGKILAIRSTLVEEISGKVIETQSLTPSNDGRFSIVHKVPARLFEHKLLVYETRQNGSDTLVRTVKGLVAGDFYLIAGQSNAEAAASYEKDQGPWLDSVYSHPACRAIGGAFAWTTDHDSTGKPNLTIEEDCVTGRPSCLFGVSGSKGFVGSWGLKLQHDLAMASGIPSCFVNAARGSSSILDCFPSRSPSSPGLLRHSEGPYGPPVPYDRAYRKLWSAGVHNYLKGIFWYQGETDATYQKDSAQVYWNKFVALRKAWKKDFPAVEKIVVVQLSIGCGGPHLRLIADQQRRLPMFFNDVYTVSSAGYEVSALLDYCHYQLPGYLRVAANLLPLSHRLFYGAPLNASSLAANIQTARLESQRHLVLEFDQEIEAPAKVDYPDSSAWRMTDNFFTDHDRPLILDSVISHERELHLYLAEGQDSVNVITYLPANYSHFGYFGGPWLVNKHNRDVGALIFYQFPVQADHKVTNSAGAPDHYPEPADDRCHVRFATGTERTIFLYNISGRLVREISDPGNLEVSVDVSGLDPGLYLLRYHGEREEGALRFVKR